MRGRLAGKIAAVTGAARGIGRAVTIAFAEEEALVYALDRLAEEVGTLQSAAIRPRHVDITDADAVAATFAEIEREAGQLDVLVNNAGIIFFKPIEEVSVADWDRLISVNLRGPFLCTRAVAAGMKRRRAGAIINVSSNAGVRGGMNESTYCSSKFGIEGFSRALAVEFAPYNVSVNTITPGYPVHTSIERDHLRRRKAENLEGTTGTGSGLRAPGLPGRDRPEQYLCSGLGSGAGAAEERRRRLAASFRMTQPPTPTDQATGDQHDEPDFNAP